MNIIKHKNVMKIALYLWLISIWVISSLPAENLPNIDTFNLDKLAHVFVYFVLSTLLFLNLRNDLLFTHDRYLLLLIAIMLAAFDEAHQEFILNRAVSIYDLSANLAGLLMGYFLILRRPDK